ncbi:esterase family protein [Jatrophihabitans telluris]|uniref:Esterase family protein n=1 Tax=Jatrophihabitans telluris TaxID=2038343 RepID=A0ABY4QXD3_9ACTN|nr:alpha/beta hydrolase-fold protein [Jatrophihabitans telluris]UQX88323.1 esterase family protein [Jatrophihabitans telluris]
MSSTFNPTSPFVLVLIFGAAIGCLVALVLLRWIAVKVVAGALALGLATFGGIVGVNDYFGYYQSWHDAITDLSGRSLSTGGARTLAQSASQSTPGIPRGRIERVTITGAASKMTRIAYVYLPPQYDQPAYRRTRFPVVELLHGTPGRAADWIVSLHANTLVDRLIATRQMGPVILVAPMLRDSNTPQECLDTPAFLDESFTTKDVPAFVRHHYRTATDGAEWGLFGISGGGYCAANIALRHRANWGAMVSIDGYYLPSDGPAGSVVKRFPSVAAAANPIVTADHLPVGAAPLPSMWLSVGTANSDDITEEKLFVAAMNHLEQVHVTTLIGGGHTGYNFRQTMPQAMEWIWGQLAPPGLRVQFPISGPPTSTVQKRIPPPPGRLPTGTHKPRKHTSKTVVAKGFRPVKRASPARGR